MRRTLPLLALALTAALTAAADLPEPMAEAPPACDALATGEIAVADPLAGAVPLTFTCAECNEFFQICLDDCDAAPYPGCYNDCRAARIACYRKCLDL